MFTALKGSRFYFCFLVNRVPERNSQENLNRSIRKSFVSNFEKTVLLTVGGDDVRIIIKYFFFFKMPASTLMTCVRVIVDCFKKFKRTTALRKTLGNISFNSLLTEISLGRRSTF